MSVAGVAVSRAPNEVLNIGRFARGLIVAIRVLTGLLWVQSLGWKSAQPPNYGGLRMWTQDAVDHPVLAPFSWVISHVVLPGFPVFGALALLVEGCLGAFILVGLATRFWAIVGIGQATVITLSALYVPGEWFWSYALMFVAHLAVLVLAAGRYGGVDGVLRPIWRRHEGRLSKLLLLAS